VQNIAACLVLTQGEHGSEHSGRIPPPARSMSAAKRITFLVALSGRYGCRAFSWTAKIMGGMSVVMPRARLGKFPGQIQDLQYGSESAALLGFSDKRPIEQVLVPKGGTPALAFLLHCRLRLCTARGISKYRLKGIRPLAVRG
jgi:hypothetical protein